MDHTHTPTRPPHSKQGEVASYVDESHTLDSMMSFLIRPRHRQVVVSAQHLAGLIHLVCTNVPRVFHVLRVFHAVHGGILCRVGVSCCEDISCLRVFHAMRVFTLIMRAAHVIRAFMLIVRAF